MHSTHGLPGGTISPDVMDGEVEPYTRSAGSDLTAGIQSALPLSGLELHLISINRILRRIWLFYFKQISS